MGALVDTNSDLQTAQKDLEAAEYWDTIGGKIEKATTNAEKFAAAIG